MARAFIGIGSNIEPAENVRAAIRSLARQTRVTGISTVYLTRRLAAREQPHYYNCVVEIETEAPPAASSTACCATSRTDWDASGRDDKYAPRTIDLDLIVYGDLAIDEENIRLPDPEILERPFLAIPLFELAPDLVLAGFNLQIREIATRLPQDGMRPLKEFARLLRNETIRRQS